MYDQQQRNKIAAALMNIGQPPPSTMQPAMRGMAPRPQMPVQPAAPVGMPSAQSLLQQQPMMQNTPVQHTPLPGPQPPMMGPMR